MENIDFVIINLLRALVEVAGWFLFGQGVLYLLAGPSREKNTVYRLFCLITRPITRIMRLIVPKQIPDKHIPLIAFFLLFWLWIGLAYARRSICFAESLVC